MHLRPDPVVTADDLARGQRALVQEGAWSNLAGALYGGVILVGFALTLDASPFLIGVLAAIPFLAQVAQLPAIMLVERIRQRRKITVVAVTIARIIILSLAAIPFVPDHAAQLALLIAAQITIAVLNSIGGCALNSWLHQLLPRGGLGDFFARRLFWATAFGSTGALIAGQAIEQWPFGARVSAYSAVFFMAGIAGFLSSMLLARVPEPVMSRAGPPLPILSMLSEPLRDANFRRVIGFMAAWNAASNLAAPFLAVYLLEQLEYGLGTVTTLWATSQIANALTLYWWGRLSDRLSNKAILAVGLPVYFGCFFGLVFTALPEKHVLTLPLLFLVHIVMGAAGGGVSLATGNITLKLAPQARGTAYLATVSLAGALAAGVAALVGGLLADWFATRALALTFHWTSPGGTQDVTFIQFQHWEFLFAIAFALGLYVIHRLSRISEGEEISERVVVQQFVVEAVRSIDQLSSIDSLRMAILVPFGRLIERRRQPRAPP
jgi:MFS family permease